MLSMMTPQPWNENGVIIYYSWSKVNQVFLAHTKLDERTVCNGAMQVDEITNKRTHVQQLA